MEKSCITAMLHFFMILSWIQFGVSQTGMLIYQGVHVTVLLADLLHRMYRSTCIMITMYNN